MKKDAMISIKGIYNVDGSPDTVELLTCGRFYRRNNSYWVSYQETETTGFEDECPAWLKPYLAAAQRSGLVRGYATETGAEFRANEPITGAEAASMVSLALELPSAVISEDRELPVWAATWRSASSTP